MASLGLNELMDLAPKRFTVPHLELKIRHFFFDENLSGFEGHHTKGVNSLENKHNTSVWFDQHWLINNQFQQNSNQDF